MSNCSFQDCGRVVRGRGLCGAHWAQSRRGSELHPVRSRRPEASICVKCGEPTFPGSSYCGPCKKAVWTEWWHSSGKHDEKVRERRRAYAREYNRPYKLRTQYDMEPEEYDVLVELQDRKCKICRRELGEIKRLDVDHDHRTNLVRGLLCPDCNRGIGQFADSPERLFAAAEYLVSASAMSGGQT